jgi:aspartate/methionine/tyrosine aminotransferase
MRLAPFRIEQYYAVHEFTASHMLSSSDAETVALADLLTLEPDAEARLLGLRLGYTESPGAPELRTAIAAIYERLDAEDVIVVAAAEEGIFTAYHTLLQPGDHVVVETPCYESALEVARSTGAEVTEWRRSYADAWAHDLESLEQALRPDTRLVYVNTPHNPTGTLMPRPVLDHVVALCAERGSWLFCDEVYRELEHDPVDRLPAACDLYERALSLGSMSKSYGLPGLRLGWLASRDRDALARIVDLKHYTTICSSAPSELLSALALRHHTTLAERNRVIVQRNLPLLDAFFDGRAATFSWVRPTASPIGFPRLLGHDDTRSFCERLVAETGVLLLPGDVYDEPGHVRVGFGRLNMPEALERLDAWLGGR